MRDFVPEAAAARRRIAESLLGVFDRWGFARVITPAFEYEDVLALGLGSAGRAAAIRFVEPSSGQVVALPPDITPQIARLIATRYRDEPGPLRLAYEGTVVRLDQRARSQREVIQAGVELAGVTGPRGDAEIVALGAAALEAVGFADGTPVTMDLGHLGLALEVLAGLGLDDEGRESARARIAKRDRAGLAEVLRGARGARAVIEFAALLPELCGPADVVAIARKRSPARPAGIRRALDQLRALLDELQRQRLPARLHVDLCEVRGFDYYTGMRVQGYVPGWPEPLLQGGRYDSLLARYGRSSPAVGFAIDVEATAGALELRPAAAGSAGNGARDGGVLVSGPVDAARAAVAELRRAGRRAAVELGGLAGEELRAYAQRWRFAEVRNLSPNLSPMSGANPSKSSGRNKLEGMVPSKLDGRSAPGRARPRGA
jgi:ATP phosphoribosyltransferase regulatory subunit